VYILKRNVYIGFLLFFPSYSLFFYVLIITVAGHCCIWSHTLYDLTRYLVSPLHKPLPHKTQHIHALAGFEANPNKRVAGKLHLRPRGHRMGRFSVCYV